MVDAFAVAAVAGARKGCRSTLAVAGVVVVAGAAEVAGVVAGDGDVGDAEAAAATDVRRNGGGDVDGKGCTAAPAAAAATVTATAVVDRCAGVDPVVGVVSNGYLCVILAVACFDGCTHRHRVAVIRIIKCQCSVLRLVTDPKGCCTIDKSCTRDTMYRNRMGCAREGANSAFKSIRMIIKRFRFSFKVMLPRVKTDVMYTAGRFSTRRKTFVTSCTSAIRSAPCPLESMLPNSASTLRRVRVDG